MIPPLSGDEILTRRAALLGESLRREGYRVTIDGLVAPDGAARYLGDIATKTLANWRALTKRDGKSLPAARMPAARIGPPWVKIRRSIMYRLSDLIQWRDGVPQACVPQACRCAAQPPQADDT